MKRLDPIFFLNILIVLFLFIILGLLFFLVKESLGVYYIIALLLIALFLLFILFLINKKNIPASDKILNTIDEYKGRLSYNDHSFTIRTYSSDLIIHWNTIEAIFLIISPPLDGEYHNKEYRIILNEDPIIKRNIPLKWYNKILPNPQKGKYPLIKIDDYYNLDFDTFYDSVEKFLIKKKTLYDFQSGVFFGNEAEVIEKNENVTITVPTKKTHKTLGFFKIFDRENTINDNRLKEYRNNAQT